MEPISYEDLPDHIKENLSAGHILAAHLVETEKGWGLRKEHLTTVQHTSDDIATGAPVYYCNDICGNECEPGTVRMLMMVVPKKHIATTEWPVLNVDSHQWRSTAKMAEVPPPPVVMSQVPQQRYDEINVQDHHLGVGKDFMTPGEMAMAETLRAEYFDGLDGDIPEQTPLEKLSFFAGEVESFYAEVSEFHLAAEKAFAGQARLEKLREWTYERYRHAVHSGSGALSTAYATELFYIVTGLKPSEDRELFEMYLVHLSDAVLVYDADTLPEFQPDSEPDCGD